MERHKRPRQTISKTVRMETGCGHLYVTVGRDNGNVIEIFAILGKGGSCATSQNEALTRAISLGLKHGIPLKEYAEELEGIKCPYTTWENGEKNASCADAIAKVLKEEAK